MEPKRECSLAVTQILHLHLYKNRLSGEPLWLPHPLFLFFLFLSLLLSFHVCCGFGRCHFQHVFCAPRTLCVLIVGHPWGRGGERWGGPVWEQPCQVLWYDSAWSCRHLVCLKGKRKVDLASSLRFSSCPPFAFSSTSLPLLLSHSLFFFFVSAILELSVKTAACTACAQASHLFSPALSHQSRRRARCSLAPIQVHETPRLLKLFGSVTLKRALLPEAWELLVSYSAKPVIILNKSWWEPTTEQIKICT